MKTEEPKIDDGMCRVAMTEASAGVIEGVVSKAGEEVRSADDEDKEATIDCTEGEGEREGEGEGTAVSEVC